MKTYIFAGSAPIGATIDGMNVFLVPGRTYELPEGNSFVQGLEAQGLLVETRDRADNFIGDGRKLSYTVPSGQSVAAGALVAIGNIVGVAETEGSAGETIVLSLSGVWSFATSDIINKGEAVFLSGAGVSKTGIVFVGVAASASQGGNVSVSLNYPGDFYSPVVSPTNWLQVENPNNPFASAEEVPVETVEQYVPSPIKIGGTLYCYIKGDPSRGCYLYRSDDNGLTWEVMNGGVAVLQPDRSATNKWNYNIVECFAIHDEAANIIRIWYKGYNIDSANYSWGYATAPVSAPQTVTKAAEPMFTGNQLATLLSVENSEVVDNSPRDLIKIGSDFVFYFEYRTSIDGVQRNYIAWAKASAFNTAPTEIGVILVSPRDGAVQCPCVFRDGGLYWMSYTASLTEFDTFRQIFSAWSTDGYTWNKVSSPMITQAAIVNNSDSDKWNAKNVYASRWLKDGSGSFDRLTMVEGRYLHFVSGRQTFSNIDTAGVYFVYPNVAVPKAKMVVPVLSTPTAITATDEAGSSKFFVAIPSNAEFSKIQFTATMSGTDDSEGGIGIAVRDYFPDGSVTSGSFLTAVQLNGDSHATRQTRVLKINPEAYAYRLSVWLVNGATTGEVISIKAELFN